MAIDARTWPPEQDFIFQFKFLEKIILVIITQEPHAVYLGQRKSNVVVFFPSYLMI